MAEENIVENVEEVVKKIPKKRGRKPKKTGYFLEEQEESFRRFLACENEREKNAIFSKEIYPALCKMVECIIRRWHLFSVDESYEDIFTETLSFLITKIKNFKPDNGTKAYSYCGTICKRYLIMRRKTSMKKRDKVLSYEVVFPTAEKDKRISETYDENEDFHENLIKNTKDEISNILEIGKNGKRNLSQNEIRVGNALIDILENWEDVWKEMEEDKSSRKFQKLSMLSLIKEYTLCSTTEVRNAMKIYKNIYLFTKNNLLKE